MSPLNSSAAPSAQPTVAPVSKERIARLLDGRDKPKTEAEGLAAMSAVMWKKSFETALASMGGEDQDALSAPQSKAIKDQQAAWMGVEAAAAFGSSMAAQLSHVHSSGTVAPKP